VRPTQPPLRHGEVTGQAIRAGQTIATDGGGEKSGGIVSEQIGTYQVLQRMLGLNAKLSYAVADDITGTPVPASALSHGAQPVGFQNSDTGADLRFYTARSYSLMRPPRTGRRWIRSWIWPTRSLRV
jgi:hypothetical protein